MRPQLIPDECPLDCSSCTPESWETRVNGYDDFRCMRPGGGLCVGVFAIAGTAIAGLWELAGVIAPLLS